MKKLKNSLYLYNPIYWPAWLGLGCLWLITRLPIAWQLHIGRGLGKIIYYSSSKLRHISKTNIDLCFPHWTPAQKETLLRKNFAALGIGIIEMGMAWWLSDKKLQHSFRLIGLEYAEQALAQGKGIILIGPHFTSLEMIGRLLGTHYTFGVMYRPHKKPFISFIHQRFREKHYVNYIPSHRIRSLLTALKNNMPIWYAYDIDGGKKRSVFAPFFGISTATLTSVSRLARMSEAAIIPIYFHRCDDEFKYEITLLPAVENFPSSDLTADATRLNAILEDAIRVKPEQYIWQYKRFKTRPEGEERFY